MRHDLNALTRKGVHLALDDFGTGYASLIYLKRFPLDEVKIDRSLVSRVADDVEGRAVVAAVVSLCRGLGITATAEGVEAPQQLAALRDMGCHRAQGYLIGRPQAPDALQRRLLAGGSHSGHRSAGSD
jgi:EAL domain-containing protein (putative c-di-GMP-specific phosphodiesterase class I)